MPLERYRRAEDVPPPAPIDPSDPVALARMWAFLRTATEGWPRLHAPGVHRYASIEAADADRRAAEVARMRQVRARRR